MPVHDVTFVTRFINITEMATISGKMGFFGFKFRTVIAESHVFQNKSNLWSKLLKCKQGTSPNLDKFEMKRHNVTKMAFVPMPRLRIKSNQA